MHHSCHFDYLYVRLYHQSCIHKYSDSIRQKWQSHQIMSVEIFLHNHQWQSYQKDCSPIRQHKMMTVLSTRQALCTAQDMWSIFFNILIILLFLWPKPIALIEQKLANHQFILQNHECPLIVQYPMILIPTPLCFSISQLMLLEQKPIVLLS